MEIRPVTFKQAREFVKALHRHNKPPVGHKFSVGCFEGAQLVGVGIAGRPVARALNDGLTVEVCRTCTDGTPNANSMIYGALRQAAWALGYRRLVTYTQADECGGSLRGAGFVRVKELAARLSWAESSVKLREKRDPVGNGDVARVRWECQRHG